MTDITPHLIHVLIVEDDDAHAELIELALEESRIANPRQRVSTGEQALEALRERADDKDLPQFGFVMLDLKLPGISGLDVLKAIRGEPATQYLPVVMLTTSVNDRDRSIAYNHGVNSYVKKPLDFESFQQVVRDLEYYWCIHNVPRNGVDVSDDN